MKGLRVQKDEYICETIAKYAFPEKRGKSIQEYMQEFDILTDPIQPYTVTYSPEMQEQRKASYDPRRAWDYDDSEEEAEAESRERAAEAHRLRIQGRW